MDHNQGRQNPQQRRSRDQRQWWGPNFAIRHLEVSKAVWVGATAKAQVLAEVKYQGREAPRTTQTVTFYIADMLEDEVTTDERGVAATEFTFHEPGSNIISAEIRGVEGTRIYRRISVPPTDPELLGKIQISRLEMQLLEAKGERRIKNIEERIKAGEVKKRKQLFDEPSPPELTLISALPGADAFFVTVLRTRKGKPEAGKVFYTDPESEPKSVDTDANGIAKVGMKYGTRRWEAVIFLPENPSVKHTIEVPLANEVKPVDVQKDIEFSEAKKRKQLLDEPPPPELQLVSAIRGQDTFCITVLLTREGKSESGQVFYSYPEQKSEATDTNGVLTVKLGYGERKGEVVFFLPENPRVKIPVEVPTRPIPISPSAASDVKVESWGDAGEKWMEGLLKSLKKTSP